MSIEIESERRSADTYEQYRALSSAAVASLIVGVLSAMAILGWSLVAVPIVGVVLGTYAWLHVRSRADELSGAGIARAGLALSCFFLVLGPGWLTYEYLTEVPDGYRRTSYAELQPDPNQIGQQVPPSAMELDGKKIFIKGYVYPGRQTDRIRDFLLVRDRGECCFGGDPKITDRIQVTLEDPLRLTYRPRLHKLGGTFRVEPAPTTIDGAPGGIFYHLKADYLE